MTTPFASFACHDDVAVASGTQRPRARRRASRLVSLLVPLVFSGAAMAQTPSPVAFPGAEGAGRFSLGGRGGAVLHVTTLADEGPGSLRAAIAHKGPRIIVFDVDGTIALASPLVVREARVTIAGQSAPGDGIALRNYPLIVAADDVVIRYVRARLGDESGAEEDAVTVARGQRIMLDHVSASWSIDETLSVAGRYEPREAGPYDVTVQWSLIAESLNQSRHAKGAHGYGTLVRGAFGARISFHHNLWAHHRARNPRPGNYHAPDADPVGPLIEFRSNVFYNWGGRFAGYDADTTQRVTYAFIDNAYIAGPNSAGALAFQEENAGARALFAGNSMNGAIPADPWSLVENADTAERLASLPWPQDIASDTAPLERVLATAGASRRRDSVDARIVESVRTRSGKIIDSQGEVGGWPALRAAPAPLDSDRDGMPDAWERAHGLDPHAGDDKGDADGDGYTNIEAYLNGLVR
jgi:hypothetical protein